jgi:phosphoribosylamine--glycine ligase
MKEDLTVMVIGFGAREHALVDAYQRSTRVRKVVAVPGNDFMKVGARKEVIIDKSVNHRDPSSILAAARKYRPDITDVAQDDAIASGAVDVLEQNGYRAFGPSQRASRIECDKAWSRNFMHRHGIPQPGYRIFDNIPNALDYASRIYSGNPRKVIYIKASGLCGGKGALRAESLEEAQANIRRMEEFGSAGKKFLVEYGVDGEEYSFFAFSDGKTYRALRSAQDHKRLLDNDMGLQTGGMGAISPAMVTAGLSDIIEKTQVVPVIGGMSRMGIPYRGIFYVGGMYVSPDQRKNGGRITTIEYNARFGDPEAQVVVPSLQSDFADVIMACLDGKLHQAEVRQDDRTRVCVVGAAKGYPDDCSGVQGKRIYGLKEAARKEGVTVYGTGIAIEGSRFYADTGNSGRLFSIVGEGRNIDEARNRAYDAIGQIKIGGENPHYRKDIGLRDLRRFRQTMEVSLHFE